MCVLCCILWGAAAVKLTYLCYMINNSGVYLLILIKFTEIIRVILFIIHTKNYLLIKVLKLIFIYLIFFHLPQRMKAWPNPTTNLLCVLD